MVFIHIKGGRCGRLGRDSPRSNPVCLGLILERSGRAPILGADPKAVMDRSTTISFMTGHSSTARRQFEENECTSQRPVTPLE
jgi:hypothetical protein